MFMPGRDTQKELQEKKQLYKKVENIALQLIPESMRNDVTISVQEVQCGDPQCAPIDTVVTILFESGGQGMFGLPMEAKEVTDQDMEHVFPPPDIIEKWHQGEEAEWPPPPEPVQLRFEVGTEVLCRVGATDWAPGRVIQLWYREPNWPEGAFAPYKIRLDDGRDIFAPADMDQIIKQNPNPPQRPASDTLPVVPSPAAAPPA